MFLLTGRSDLLEFLPANHPALAPGQSARIVLNDDAIGWLGILHPAVQTKLDLKNSVVLFAVKLDQAALARIPEYETYSKYPHVRRDIALVLIVQELALNHFPDGATSVEQDLARMDRILAIHRRALE